MTSTPARFVDDGADSSEPAKRSGHAALDVAVPFGPVLLDLEAGRLSDLAKAAPVGEL